VATACNYVENALYQTSHLVGSPLWPVHRLDTPTTGLLLFSKSSKECARLTKSFRARTVHKFYSLIAEAESPASPDLPPAGTLVTHWMDLSGTTAPKPIAFREDAANGFDKEAKLVIEDLRDLAPEAGEPEGLRRKLVMVKLLTGRTHQIRAQFGLLGWPLRNDVLYRPHFCRDTVEASGLDPFNPVLDLRCYRMQFEFKDHVFDVSVDPNVPK